MGNYKVITLQLYEQFYLFCEDENTDFQDEPVVRILMDTKNLNE